MHLIVGSDLDGTVYPGPDEGRGAALGTVVVGWHGLLGVLETRLGLAGPPVSPALRIAQYQRRLSDTDDGRRFYSASLAADAWNTARTLLGWRDDLIAAGWTPWLPQPSQRLGDLAAVEAGRTPLAPGWSDRLRAVLAVVAERPLDVEQLTLTEDPELWPPHWQDLLAAVAATGVRVDSLAASPPRADSSDLGRLQRALTGSPGAPAEGDGSVLYVAAEHDMEAADALAALLECSPADAVVIRGSGSVGLDARLHRRGLARLGVDNPSPWRAGLQVLPLALAVRWAPFNPARFLELLTLPHSPVPGLVRGRLALAVAQHPGRGGPLWQDALAEARAAYEARWADQGLSAGQRAQRRRDLDQAVAFWCGHDTWDPVQGMPTAVALMVCEAMAAWAGERAARDGDPLLAIAQRRARDVAQALSALGVDTVTQAQLGRILDAVEGPGAGDIGAEPEAAPWTVVERPGQVWGPAETVLWWDFAESSTTGLRAPWTVEERSGLLAAGVRLEAEGHARRREAATWRRVALACRGTLILLGSRRGPDGLRGRHPFWDEVRAAIAADAAAEARLTVVPGQLRRRSRVAWGPFVVERDLRPSLSPPAPLRQWRVAPGRIAPRAVESPTSMELLLGCPLAWTLEHAAALRPARLLTIPDDPVMLGNLAHRIVADLLDAPSFGDPDELQDRAARLWDAYLPEMAAPLLEPQRRLLRDRSREALVRAVVRLAEVLRQHGLTPVGTEVEKTRPLHAEAQMRGRLDLLLADGAGRPAILDLKWSAHRNRYQEPLQEGRSVQLAAYQWLLAEPGPVPAGYYLLSIRTLVTVPDPVFPESAHVPGPSLEDTWATVAQRYQEDLAAVMAGGPEARGVDPPADAAPLVPPPCDHCVYSHLCGWRRSA